MDTTITTQKGNVTIRALSIKELADSVKSFKDIMATLGDKMKEQGTLSKEEAANMLMGLITDGVSGVFDLLALPTDKDGAFVSSLDVADTIELIDGILTANRFEVIRDSIKKVLARTGLQTTAAQPSTPALPEPEQSPSL